jgi:anti-sigma-K factor RskA
MSGTSADDPEELAGDYVLGCLEGEERAAADRRRATDPDFRAAIEAWEERLLPLAQAIPPVAPPAALWARIEASLVRQAALDAQAAAPRPGPAARAWRSVGLWRAATLAAAAVAAVFAGLLLVRPAPPPPTVAALAQYGGPGATFVAELQRDGSVRVSAVAPVQVATGRDLELWALPPGAQRPIPLGVLPATGKVVPLGPIEAAGTQLLVSLEPQGGSPTGQPTGPVLYSGRLTKLE